MKNQVRNLLFKALRYSGLPALLRNTLQRQRVTIVMFHDPTPEAAEQAFLYLKKQYNLIDLNTFINAGQTGASVQLPKKALIITLDDGHIRNYDLLPILKKHQIPVTIFLCAGVVNTNRHFWFTKKHPEIRKADLKRLPNRMRLAALAEAGYHPEQEYDTPHALNKMQIEEMRAVVNFQGHTLFHPCLPYCSDERAHKEIVDCKTILEQEFDLPINALAFPNGDYSERDIALVKAAGYACAITVDFGFNTLKTDPYRLKRISIDDSDNVDTVAVKASGLWTLLLGLLGRRRWTRLAPTLPQLIVQTELLLFQFQPAFDLTPLAGA